MNSTLSIPALPLGYVRALELLRDPDADLEFMTSIGTDDPAFAVALLRAANSAESAPARRIATVREAVVRLGAVQARRTILAVTLRQAFRGSTGSGVDEHELWRHLSAVAMVAEDLAWGEVRYSEAFTAGLLHDVGRLALASHDPSRYAKVVRLTRQGASASEVERRAFGVDHSTWGAELCTSWGLAPDLIEAISHHHAGDSSGLAWVLAEARDQVLALGIGDGVNLPSQNPPVGDALSLSESSHDSNLLQRIDCFARLARAA